MQNRLYGILTIGVAIIIYTIAYKKYRTEQYGNAILMIMLGGLILRVFTSCDMYLHAWDERYHALVAKNLLTNPLNPMLYSTPLLDYDFRHWTSNHIWVHKQPLPIYSMAASMWVFGKNVIALRLPSIILSTLAILSTYKIGKLIESKKIGLLAAFLFSINGLIIEQTAGRVATDHIDVFFFSLISFAVYFLLKSTKQDSKSALIIGSLFTGLAILSKWLPALIVLPVWFIYSYRKITMKQIISRMVIFSTIIVTIVLPWQLYILHNFPVEANWEYAYNKKHIFETLGAHGEPFYYHINRMRIIFGELIYLPMIWYIYRSIKVTKNGNSTPLLILIWIMIPYLFFSVAQTKMQGYILFCAPAIFIVVAHFFDRLQHYDLKIAYIKSIILFLLIALPVRYAIERIKPFSNKDRQQPWISEVKKIESQNQDQKIVIFNTKHPIETMFHTDMIAYKNIPSLDILEEINEQGYKIYMDDNMPISNIYIDLEYLHYINLE